MINQADIQMLRSRITADRALPGMAAAVPVPRDLLEKLLDQVEIKRGQDSERRRH